MALLPLNLSVQWHHNAVSFACGANRRVTIRTWRQWCRKVRRSFLREFQKERPSAEERALLSTRLLRWDHDHDHDGEDDGDDIDLVSMEKVVNVSDIYLR